ncbi:MAG: tetratricopeptide repeat protein [Candidatus Obscuribacterales bacterium]|nr:tetratricopeptide repeat protein [Candidatus Obscuribacterales bacterium]
MRSSSSIFLSFLLLAGFSFATSSMPADCKTHNEKKHDLTVGNWKAEAAEAERYLEKTDLEKAELCAANALKTVKRAVPHTEDELVFCQMLLANIIYKQDRFDEALPLYKSSLSLSERKHGKFSNELLPILLTLGLVYEIDGNYKKASKCYDSAIAICSHNDGSNSPSSVLARQRLARVKAKQGRPGEAEDIDLLCLTILLQEKKLDSSDLLEEVLNDYSDLVLKTSSQGKSLNSSFQNELLKDKISDLKQKQGVASSKWLAEVSARLGESSVQEQSSSSSQPLQNSGLIRLEQSRIQPDKPMTDPLALEELNKQRIAFYERLIATDIDSLGADHPSVARDLSGLASIYLVSKNYEQAASLLKRALEIYEKVYKADSAPVRQTNILLELLSESKDPQKLNIDLSYLDSLPKLPLEAQTLAVALRLNDLAFMLYSQGKTETALKVYYWALSSTASATGKSSLLTAAGMIDMSKLFRLNGKSADAEKLENNARAIARQDILNKRSLLLP